MGPFLILASVGCLVAALVVSREGIGLRVVQRFGLHLALATPLAVVLAAVSLPDVAQAAPPSVKHLVTLSDYHRSLHSRV